MTVRSDSNLALTTMIFCGPDIVNESSHFSPGGRVKHSPGLTTLSGTVVVLMFEKPSLPQRDIRIGIHELGASGQYEVRLAGEPLKICANFERPGPAECARTFNSRLSMIGQMGEVPYQPAQRSLSSARRLRHASCASASRLRA